MSQETFDSPEPANELSPAQESALCALLSTCNFDAAAQTAGVTTRTLSRYLKQSDFRDAYRQARREAVGLSVAQLQRLTADAVQTLGSVVRDETASASTRVAAAKVILEMSLKSLELEDISERLDALEQAARELDGNSRFHG